MKNTLFIGLLATFILTATGCKKTENTEINGVSYDSLHKRNNPPADEITESDFKINADDFISKNYVIYEEILGDLNNDGLEDSVFIIKGTDKEKMILDENKVEINRNRRGIIIVFKNEKGFQLIQKNYDCFSSESEEGSAYFDPELTVNVNSGNLEIGFGHGKHGFWNYIFQLKNKDFELIKYGVTATNGKVIKTETRIDYLTKIKSVKTNSNKKNEIGEDIFKEKIEKIVVKKIVKLSEIKDFDELNIVDYID